MMTRRAMGNVIGILGLVCSLAFWALVGVGRLMGHFPASLDMPFNGWLLIWTLAFLLSLTAAFLGPRWWVFTSILPVVGCIIAIHVVSVPF